MTTCIMCKRIHWLNVSADNSRDVSFGARTRGNAWPTGSARPWPCFRLSWLLVGSAMTIFLAAGAVARAPGNPDQRAEALLSQMTLEEKIGQMTQVDMNALKDKADIQKYDFGSMLSGGDSDPADITAKGWLKACEEYQSWALKSRLKIPLIYGIDAVHGDRKSVVSGKSIDSG